MEQTRLFDLPPRQRAAPPVLPPTPAALLRAELATLPAGAFSFMDAPDAAHDLTSAIEALSPGSVGRVRCYDTRGGWRVALTLCGLRVTGLGPASIARALLWLRGVRQRCPLDERGMMIGRLAWALGAGGES